MTEAERWKQVKTIFHAVLEKPPGERTIFLRQSCNHNDDLFNDVQSLLRAHDQAASFVERPVIELLDTETLRSLDSGGRSLRCGDDFGPYVITDFIAAGGMGEVYKARDLKLNRDLAIKILPSTFTGDAHRLARFKREARSLAALNHSHVESIFELRESNGLIGLVLEFVEGETLAERISRGPLGIVDAIAIAKQIALGLDATHEAGIIHRDLKPSNIKITPTGIVKVLDFGLAKNRDADANPSELVFSLATGR